MFSVSCFSQSAEYSVHDLIAGKYENDSSYIYLLPFENGKKVIVIQGYETNLSHKGERSLDFKVKKGTKICAAREGVVIGMKEDSEKRGLKKENLKDGNHISVLHNDGSVANYWHLKKNGVLVNIGDTVLKGQLIGLSGNTGFSAFPHLHFEVRDNPAKGRYKQIATRFITNKGIIYLSPWKFYRTLN
jgi:murein DD-endopeptidase MepM/ murein hydrolase activator NlpD